MPYTNVRTIREWECECIYAYGTYGSYSLSFSCKLHANIITNTKHSIQREEREEREREREREEEEEEEEEEAEWPAAAASVSASAGLWASCSASPSLSLPLSSPSSAPSSGSSGVYIKSSSLSFFLIASFQFPLWLIVLCWMLSSL